MVQAGFSHEMRNALRNMIGHRFIAYEYGEDTSSNTAYGNVRLNTDNGNVEIRCEERPLPFFGEMEDVACFACRQVRPEEPYVPAVITSTNRSMVDDRIDAVEILTDQINVNHNEYQIEIDVAVIFYCEHRTIMFSRGIWFSEVITISFDDDYEKVFPMQKIIESWSNEGEYDVRVQRSHSSLDL